MELPLPQWIVFFLIVVVFLLFKKGLKSRRYGPLPPGPCPLPIIGNLPIIGDMPHRSLARLAKTYGPLMSVRLGAVTTVVVSSPGVAREVLKNRDQDFCGRSPPDIAWALGHGKYGMTFNQVDQHWRDLRKVCSTQLFSSRRVDDRRGLRESKARSLVEYVRARCKAGEAVVIGRAAFAASLNLLSSTVMSVDLVDLGSSDQGRLNHKTGLNIKEDGPGSDTLHYFKDMVREIVEVAGKPNISDFFPKLRVFDLNGRRRKMAEIIGKMYAIFDEMIDRRLQEKKADQRVKAPVDDGDAPDDFLDSLIQCHLGESEIELDRLTIRSLMLELFIAGSDTASSTVEWAMAELLRNPESMSKARAEILSAVDPGKDLSESDILKLPYLQAVVKETLRLHAPTPFLIPRRTGTTVQFGRYTIPKHTRVLVNAWAIGRDPDVWKDADSFVPERFSDIDGGIDYKGRDFELIPFGAGRRICPGLLLGARMIHMILASLLRSFEWKLPDGIAPEDLDMEDKFGFTLGKAVPLRAIPVLDAMI